MIPIGLIDHLEDPLSRRSSDVYNEVTDLVTLADELGVRYAWFAEHHAHVHLGHLPTPLMFALHMAERTRRIHLGSAVICIDLHHPLDVAEQVAVADVLSGGRMAPGFGSSCTPDEAALFGAVVLDPPQHHARLAEAIDIMRSAWRGERGGTMLPLPRPDLAERCWIAVNSVGAARVAGTLNFNMLFSYLRTPEQYREFVEAYRAAGGNRLVAGNRPVYVGPDDASALEAAEPALRSLWRRFRDDGKIPADAVEPESPAQLTAHPINFVVGGPDSVATQLRQLRAQAPFDALNIEVRWPGLAHQNVKDGLARFMREVAPVL